VSVVVVVVVVVVVAAGVVVVAVTGSISVRKVVVFDTLDMKMRIIAAVVVVVPLLVATRRRLWGLGYPAESQVPWKWMRPFPRDDAET
jgi:hypothetical protein